MAENNLLEKQASGTAMATAYLRALAAHDSRKEIRGQDNLAKIFLSEEQKKSLQNTAAREWIRQNKVALGAYEFMIARTAFFDQVVEHALEENIAQIVFLGAGYDSRPYRFEKLIQDTIIFELDTKPTQRRKQNCLRRAHIHISKQIRFVPINFDTDKLADKLVEGGFSREKRTLYIGEGVTYYLSAAVVANMLTFVRENTAPGSSICFDYAAVSNEALNGAEELRNHMRIQHANEPTKFGIRAREIDSFLAKTGFEIVEHLTADEMTNKYLPSDAGLDIGKVPSLFCLVRARVK